jgi:hypothetical protein
MQGPKLKGKYIVIPTYKKTNYFRDHTFNSQPVFMRSECMYLHQSKHYYAEATSQTSPFKVGVSVVKFVMSKVLWSGSAPDIKTFES